MARILIADDSAFVRQRMSALLKAWGYEIVEAEDGRQAVDLYSREQPDAVLLDITMPDLDGLQSLDLIMAQDPHARVAMVSAIGNKETIMKAIKAGAKDFVVKPFSPENIRAVLNRLGAPAPVQN
ncbi:MAG TPA: response regulator [Dehalococcoidia bacterium]|jgi:two-component system chemotaxis response regulator CheY|nr:response regulator [Dehalococcoidia bacterium]